MTAPCIHIDSATGINITHTDWTPSVRYLLRRHRILSLLKDKPLGSLTEIGCGSGALLAELAFLGFGCKGVETSQKARTIAKHIAKPLPSPPEIFESIDDSWRETQDYLLSLDVLEHIENDRAALLQWKDLLKKNGYILISVPAHSRKWGAGDVWAGHYRRYEKEDLKSLITSCGFTIKHIECYGFPVANLTEIIGNFYYKKQIRLNSQNKKNATDQSGVNRSAYQKISPFINSRIGKALLRLALTLQNQTLSKDIGSGYIIIAKKNEKNN